MEYTDELELELLVLFQVKNDHSINTTYNQSIKEHSQHSVVILLVSQYSTVYKLSAALPWSRRNRREGWSRKVMFILNYSRSDPKATNKNKNYHNTS
jgi:hypothetical protein